jgi:hypothetical protein
MKKIEKQSFNFETQLSAARKPNKSYINRTMVENGCNLKILAMFHKTYTIKSVYYNMRHAEMLTKI